MCTGTMTKENLLCVCVQSAITNLQGTIGLSPKRVQEMHDLFV